jgi:hypothetical protein
VLPTGYPTALALTLVVEVPLYALALHAGWRLPWWRGALLGVAVNALTHPVLWHALDGARHARSYPLVLVAAETGVALVEWAVVALVVRRDRLALGVVCAGVNAASVLAGLTLR